jgi:hypothetical protein
MSSLDTVLLPAHDERWDRFLSGVAHDIFHTARFHQFASRTDRGEAFLLLVGDADRGLAWPYVLRDLDDVEGLSGTGARDVGSLHGYTGPVSWGLRPDDPWLRSAWKVVRETWLDQGAVSAFVRFHPLVEGGVLAHGLRDITGDEVTPEGATVSVDCRMGHARALEDYARVTRQEVEQARRSGLVTTLDEDWRHAATFAGLHEATLARNQAGEEGRLQFDDVLRLREALGENLHLMVTRADGQVAAAGLFTEYAGIIQALLVGTDDAYRKLSPLKLLLDDVRRWGNERGDRVLHLGGGRGGREDALFAFKGRFSKRRHPFHTGRWVLDPAAYRGLVAARQRWLEGTGRRVASPGWFPAYRAPLEPEAPPGIVTGHRLRVPHGEADAAVIPVESTPRLVQVGPTVTGAPTTASH